MNFTFCFSKNFIYLVLAVLGLHCCRGFLLIVASGDYSVNAVPKHLIPVASPAAGHSLRSCGTQA